MSEAEIEFRLTVEEANLILEALGEQPFAKVFALVAKIQRQASEQVTASSNSEPAASPGADDGS